MSSGPKQMMSFAEFELDAGQRRLTHKGKPIAINAKAFDVLVYFAENAGRVVSKDEILAAVWKNHFVEEANLAVQISALRKVLGEQKGAPRFLVTIPGKGYEFIANVRTDNEIVIEKHRVSHFIVDIEETNDEAAAKSVGHSGRGFFQLTAAQVLAVGAVLLVVAGASVWIYNSHDRNSDQALHTANITPRQVSEHTFTTAGGMPDRVALSPNGKTLAYVGRVKHQRSLWLGDVEDNHSIQIVPFADRTYYYLAFAPQGKFIYFTARDPNHRELTLMRVSIFGGALQDLISRIDSSFSFSPDGKSLAFLRRDADGNRTALMVADAETGKNERVLALREKPEDTVGGGISWSPDGQMIAFAATDANGQGTALLTINVLDGSISKIGDTFGNRIVNIVWQPDGSGLFINRNSSNDAGDGKIWFVPYPQGEPQQITDDSINYHLASLSVTSDNKLAAVQARVDPQIRIALDGDPQKSRKVLEGARFRSEGRYGVGAAPDGKVLFTANANDSRTLWEMDADGNNQRQLTVTQKDCYDEQFGITADDRFLVFESNRSGASEIWRANRDGSDLKALTSGGGNIEPAISPDGMSVVYVADHDGKHELRRVSIEGGESIQLTKEKSFWPAVSPDGQSIAFVRGSSESGTDQAISVIPFDGGPPVKTFDVPVGAALYNRPRWSPDGKAIVYKDEVQGLWYQYLNKDKPEMVEFPDDLRVFQFAYSADGKLAYSGGLQMREVVVLENLP